MHFHAEQAANGRVVERPRSPELTQILQLLREFADRGWTLLQNRIEHLSLRAPLRGPTRPSVQGCRRRFDHSGLETNFEIALRKFVHYSPLPSRPFGQHFLLDLRFAAQHLPVHPRERIRHED